MLFKSVYIASEREADLLDAALRNIKATTCPSLDWDKDWDSDLDGSEEDRALVEERCPDCNGTAQVPLLLPGITPGGNAECANPFHDDEDERCDFCKEHGITNCRHMGM